MKQEFLRRHMFAQLHFKIDENSVIIDALTMNEYLEGIQENALLIGVRQPKEFKKVANELDYYVYCRSGQRSMKACNLLEEVDSIQTYNFLGGMLECKGKTVDPYYNNF